MCDRFVSGIRRAPSWFAIGCLLGTAVMAAPSFGRELVFIDAAVSGSTELAAAVRPEAEVVLLDPHGDEFSQIGRVLAARRDLTAIHIISHGEPGMLLLGSARLDRRALDQAGIAEWRSAFAPGATLALYGCHVAQGVEGESLLAEFARLTGADVAASTDATGALALGGNWTLESRIGSGDAAVRSPFVAGFDYTGLLATPKVGVSPSYTIFVRPGGTSRTWTFGNGTTPDPNYPGSYAVTQISYHNVGAPANYTLTRGRFEYSTDNGSTWSTYTVGAVGSTNFVSVAGKTWRFVDTLAGDTSTSNSIGLGWHLQGVSSSIGSGTSIIPDNPPTDIESSRTTIFHNVAQDAPLAKLTPSDTGTTVDGYWAIDSQSTPNLFALAFDASTGNFATLKRGAGTVPAIGQTATVSVRYYDLYQTDSSGNPIPGQGFSKTLTFTVVSEISDDLSFGNDIPVNTYTAGNQTAPALAALSDGKLAVVWQSAGQGGKSPATNNGIYGQLLSGTGGKVGGEFVISNAGSAVDEIAPAIAPLAGGRYVVAYATKAGSDYDIAFRLVEANGTVGSPIVANSTTAGDQANPSVATLTDGSFVVVWGSSTGEVRSRQFAAANGAAITAETVVTAEGFYPSVTALSNGSHAVTWIDGSDYFVRTKVAGGSEVATGIGWTGIGFPRIAGLVGGGFVVASENYEDRSTIEAARYDNSGALQGSVFRAHTGTEGERYAASVAALSDGGFVVAWMSDTGDYAYNGIFGRRFAANGTAVDTADFEINQHREGDQSYPALTGLASGGLFAAVWFDISAARIFDYTYEGDIKARVLLPVVSNVAPAFVGASTSLAVNQNAAATSIKNLLHVSDSDAGQTLTWTVAAAPSHGTLSSFSGATASSGSTDITPGSMLTYTPTAGYAGSDSFSIQVSDGTTTATRTITVTISDVTPPTVVSVVRKTPSQQSIAAGTTVIFEVTFSEPVMGVTADRFAVHAVNGSTVTGTITNVSATSTSVYEVTVTLTGGAGEFTLSVVGAPI